MFFISHYDTYSYKFIFLLLLGSHGSFNLRSHIFPQSKQFSANDCSNIASMAHNINICFIEKQYLSVDLHVHRWIDIEIDTYIYTYLESEKFDIGNS